VKGTFDYIFRLVKEGDGVKAICTSTTTSYAKKRDDRFSGICVPDSISAFNLAEFVGRLKGEGWPKS
jgi:hypothetical protein